MAGRTALNVLYHNTRIAYTPERKAALDRAKHEIERRLELEGVLVVDVRIVSMKYMRSISTWDIQFVAMRRNHGNNRAISGPIRYVHIPVRRKAERYG